MTAMTNSIGKYQIQGEIGRGGFGTVYRAWDPTVHRSVAIKVLTVQGDDDLLTRFRNEAAAAGNLHHRNIVTIHDFGEHNGTPYMVMQLLEGQTLQELMASAQPLTLLQKMNIMGQVADGLYHAHLHGIVHRDVKPPNIMVLPDETVQIMDFGIARLTASASRQTRTGFVIGTVLYMAPEQFLPNKVVDHRADIWAYGVIYYQFLAGRHPFAAAEETSVLYQVAHVDPPAISSLVPDCPPALEDVINRLLAKEPELRYSSLRDVQFDLQPVLVDLKREQAAQLLKSAKQFAGEERLEEAQAAAQHTLELDPSNREAHQLLISVKQRLQRRVIQPKIENLLQRAEQEVQTRQFQSAIDALESALRLSRTDPAIETRLGQIKALQEKARRAERLLNDAQREMRSQNLTAAFRIVSEAVDTDPGNSSASHLLSRVQREISLRETQRRLDEEISKARGLLLLQQFEEATTVLNVLAADFPEDQTVTGLLASARQDKARGEQQERRRREVASIRDILRERRFDDAVAQLESLLADFPEDPEIIQLLDFARSEVHSLRRAKAVADTRTEVDRLMAGSDFTGAARAVEEALHLFPADTALVRILQSVTAAQSSQAADQRAEAVSRILSEADEAERRGDVRAAISIIEKGLAAHAGAEPLVALAAKLRERSSQSERWKLVGRHSAAIETAIAARQFSQAFQLIDLARQELGGDPTLEALESKTMAARNAADLEMAQRRIRSEIDAGRPATALDMVGTALRRFPGEPVLVGLEQEIRTAIRTAKEAAAAAANSAAVGATRGVGSQATASTPAPVRVATVPSPEERAQEKRAPLPAADPQQRSRFSLYAAGAVAVLLVLSGTAYLLKPRHVVQTPPPVSTSAPPVRTGSETSTMPGSVKTPIPAARKQVVTRASDSAAPRREQRADLTPGRSAQREPETQKPAPAETYQESTPPVLTPPVSAPAGRRVVGDSGPGARGVTVVSRVGKMAWSGELPPGGRVVVGSQGIVSGPGQLSNSAEFPGWSEVDITGVRGGQVTVATSGSNSVTITNTGSAPVAYVEVTWKQK
jgi:serine/threonine-protein kinase